ncbi:DUF4397 domain-containing protein [Niastella caeni]|uniref:DUF4397 domain-containing protein n=1 Tax=Niastella caeni TaxID=2569763 RepID=A0A4S8HX92_9BACT|nr:DUF4397 domain-containing protein [Niastella caeni]THU40105.1 DUF4397 domain-containing protein [Niastella caeni]
MKTVQVRKNAFLFLGALSFLTVLLSGCLKEAQNSTTTPKAYLSLMHLAPRAPAIQVFFDNVQASSAINPGTVSAAYSPVDPKAFAISFKKSGADSVVASLGTALYDSLKYYTLLLYNEDPTHVKAVRILDDYRVLTTDKSYYRFFHMSPDIDPVDVYFDNNLILSGRSYADNVFGSFYNEFSPASPNTYNIYVKKAGSDSVIASVSSVYLNAANAYTIYLKGMKGGTGTTAIGVDVLQAAD